MTEAKEWFSVNHNAKSTTVTCSIQEGNLSVKWAVKTYATQIEQGVAEARCGARDALRRLREAVEG